MGYSVTGDAFQPGTVRLYAPVRLADTGIRPGYDVHPKDGRVLAVLPASGRQADINSLHVVLNLRALLHSGR